jgi:hypothetical protein
LESILVLIRSFECLSEALSDKGKDGVLCGVQEISMLIRWKKWNYFGFDLT